jgi:hypothetical protein
LRLVDIVMAVLHSSGHVLMDFKPMNVVHVLEKRDFVLKRFRLKSY